jgi:polyhydroxyalkanoate synthase
MASHEQRLDTPADPFEYVGRWIELAERGQKALHRSLRREAESDGFRIPDPAIVAGAYLEWGMKTMANPKPLLEAQVALWRDSAALWQAALEGRIGEGAQPIIKTEKSDRRFKDDAWEQAVIFNLLKQSYLLVADWMQSTVRRVDGLDEQTARKVDFYTRQLVDAMSPSNFVLTNPKALRTTIESGGENLLKGFENLIADLERGKGRLDIAMTDCDAFQLGENITVTPGKVVYQNELMQLLQYAPATQTVHRRPLLIVPPWINKFYILDLQPKNSFIRWAVEQGHTVFVISWVNPGAELSHKTFQDYMREGPLAALDAMEKGTGEREANVIGYCIGGTLTAITLAYMAAKGDTRVKSATFFTSMVDFAEPGELCVFIDEEQLAGLEKHMNAKGYLEGHHMATVFNLLRDKDLIWSFVVNNYLLGKDPFPFDLLYWNSDSTRMPAMMHQFYLRNMYQRNLLVQPGGIDIDGVPIDLRKVKLPTYILSTREDHIAPWKSTYAATQIYSGPVRFVLAASGHIAGAINPPAANKYGYWTNPRKPKDPEAWLRGAQQFQGSWWPDWAKWVARYAGKMVPARIPGDGKLEPIEDAPGSYVKVRISE